MTKTGDDNRLEYLERLCKLMHRMGVHELSDGGVHIALMPKPPLPRGRAASAAKNGKAKEQEVYLGVPTDEQLLYWSAGPAAPQHVENPEAVMDPNDVLTKG